MARESESEVVRTMGRGWGRESFVSSPALPNRGGNGEEGDWESWLGKS